MAGKEIIKILKLPIQALSEKYGVSKGKIESILERLPNKELGVLDWRDLDAVVQEELEGMSDCGRSTDWDTRYLDWCKGGGR